MSKSRYCKGIQCPKILWMDRYMPEKADGAASDAVLETGVKVGELARQYFGDCVVVNVSFCREEMVSATRTLMEQGTECIAEAAFTHDGLYCAVDLLHKNNSGWDIVEVKSSTRVKEEHIEDMAFQYHVLRQCGVPVGHIYCMHIDSTYVRMGELDIRRLFALEDCTESVKEQADGMEKRIREIQTYIDTDTEPERELDCYCEKPYPCVYRSYCGRHIPEHSVFDLVRMQTKKKYTLYHQGIISYADLMEHPEVMNDNQRRQVESVCGDRPDVCDKEEIRTFLDTLSYPVYHLDFETFQQAVPEFDGIHPYEQIPFQYSIHVEDGHGGLRHLEFLAEEGKDPRRTLAQHLIADIPENACVTAYNMSFEKTVIRHLAATFPDIGEHLLHIHDHIVDLMVPFQKQYYYSAAMQGSYSIKYVLPALWPEESELDYHRLEGVHNGAEASAYYADMGNHSADEIAVMRTHLLKYCGLDTYAMVMVLRKLREVCGEN
ncbi:MAG: DUF2779 domain-containing protein [Lachnospiraceae bacterium]|nr:DUF2779 domain-containing protein [Lachnospiraceae bacterium]